MLFRSLTIRVCHEVRRQETFVKLHALSEFEVNAEGVGLFYRDDTVFADLVECLGEDFADGWVC